MPLLPLLIRTGMSVGLDRYWLGFVIPNLAFVAGVSDLRQRAEAFVEVSRRIPQPCRFTMASTHTGT